MPGYPSLAATVLSPADIKDDIAANMAIGVPYSDAMLKSAAADFQAQADPNADPAGLEERYGEKVQARDFDGDPRAITEMDALVAYLQMLGTLVDFTSYEPRNEANLR
jgi:cytochrome c oxidase cbb3-type subunit 2